MFLLIPAFNIGFGFFLLILDITKPLTPAYLLKLKYSPSTSSLE